MLELSMDYYFGSIICFFMKDVYLCTFLFDITPYDSCSLFRGVWVTYIVYLSVLIFLLFMRLRFSFIIKAVTGPQKRDNIKLNASIHDGREFTLL